MAEKDDGKRGKGPGIRIDYDQPDVEDIMRQLRDKITAAAVEGPNVPPCGDTAPTEGRAGSRPSEEKTPPAAPEPPSPPVYSPLVPGPRKRILLKLMRPFAPLIKLLILPVHQEMKETVNRLDHANRRLDYISDRIQSRLDSLSSELYAASDKLQLKVDDVSTTTNQRVDRAFQRFEDLDRTMEYVKLLHSLCHNIVVELTKLKIEEEGLKTQARILEKDFSFLDRKEKALERKIYE